MANFSAVVYDLSRRIDYVNLNLGWEKCNWM